MYAWVSIYAHVSYFWLLRGSGRKDIPMAMSTLVPRSCFLSVILQYKKAGSLVKWVILELG